VPGVSVIATARAGFGVDEANWLPADALDRLGRAAPITIGELSAAEIDELRHAAPQLAPLLADGHPAQQVARNLFRLSRLAASGSADSQRTEIDMARQWWDVADGPDDGRRERARALRAVADGALAGAGTVNVDSLPPAAVDALVRSESLRDFGNDRVAPFSIGFRSKVRRQPYWRAALNSPHALPSNAAPIRHLGNSSSNA
jgi:hypothetical protein